jgi:hypothetical protein
VPAAHPAPADTGCSPDVVWPTVDPSGADEASINSPAFVTDMNLEFMEDMAVKVASGDSETVRRIRSVGFTWKCDESKANVSEAPVRKKHALVATFVAVLRTRRTGSSVYVYVEDAEVRFGSTEST